MLNVSNDDIPVVISFIETSNETSRHRDIETSNDELQNENENRYFLIMI